MALSLILTVAAACIFAELVGYWLHVLLHNEKIPFLSRNHMIHHLVVYARNTKVRPLRVGDASEDPAELLFMGLEWLFPIGAILPLALIVLRIAGLSVVLQAAFVATSLLWGLLMFNYMHDALHEKSFWMERSSFWRNRFRCAQRRHDIHHMDIDAAGRLTRNYGIFFFFFDRLFGTFADRRRSERHDGLKTAFKRYAVLFSGRAPLES
ncbi:MAG: sterol desaturase family protein [Elusimicrobiota bacterium]